MRRLQASLVFLLMLASAPSTSAEPGVSSIRSGTTKFPGAYSVPYVIYTVPDGKVFVLTDLTFLNPNFSGTVDITINMDATVRWQTLVSQSTGLLEQHWTTGLVFGSGTEVSLDTTAIQGGTNYVNWSGYLASAHL